jgi:hypothetical protein
VKRSDSAYAKDNPTRRPLKIFSSDPMLGRADGNWVTIDVPNEELTPGPAGSRLQVVDYDGVHDCVYEPVNLNAPAILMKGGLDPTESDPRFHQQMVYAVAAKVLENFERALGRRLSLTRRGRPLRLFPHAFRSANACYDDQMHAVLFGYFVASSTDPGPNLPGQTVFTCLSHDIIAHEMTHALVHRLRPFFQEATNPDVLAFHEGFSDIVALFQHFSYPDLLRQAIQRQRTNLKDNALLVGLAQQFGYARGSGRALRSAIDVQDKTRYANSFEAHDRGAVLVGAIFDAFFRTYQRRIADLIRIATSGTGNLPEGDLHPDLVSRVAAEASGASQSMLNMCIRAFDYLPPVDVTFGDYLRALVTADRDLVPDDQHRQRAAVIEAFRLRGVFPERVSSLAEESVLIPEANVPARLPQEALRTLALAAQFVGRPINIDTSQFEYVASQYQISSERLEEADEGLSDVAKTVHKFADDNRQALLLHPTLRIRVSGFHPVLRVAPDGQPLIEIVVQLVQTDDSRKEELGGLPFRGGTTLIVQADGRIRYLIAKPLPEGDAGPATDEAGARRLTRTREYVAELDRRDPRMATAEDSYLADRMKMRSRLQAIHLGWA